jgi:hypothetical protein
VAIAARGDSKDEEHPYQVLAYPTGEGTLVLLCRTLCWIDWDATETHMFFKFMNGRDMSSYFLATERGRGVPKLPPSGVHGGQELRTRNNVKVIPAKVESAITSDFYSYSRTSIRRNLYRIPIQ